MYAGAFLYSLLALVDRFLPFMEEGGGGERGGVTLSSKRRTVTAAAISFLVG